MRQLFVLVAWVTVAVAVQPAFASSILNGDFETGDLSGWTTLGINPPPTVSTNNAHSGTYSLYLGTDSGAEPAGNGSIFQPIGTVLAGQSLSFWYRTFTTDFIAFDWQDAYITDAAGSTILSTIFHQANNLGWTQQTVDLTPWAGQSIGIEFLVHQDGFGDDTSMHIDDVMVTPEPFSAGLCLSGFGAIMLGAWKRRCKA